MKRTIVVCTLVLSASMLLAAQRQQGPQPCKKCKQEAVELIQKMKTGNVSMKSAIEKAEADARCIAVTAFVEWGEGQQPLFAIYCANDAGIKIVELDHTGKVLNKEPAVDLPSIHDEEAHKPAPFRGG